MTFLTIFTAPKPFTNPHIAVIQRNAIQSWLHLGPEVNILLVGEEDGLAQVAEEFGVPLLRQVQRSSAGTPLVSSIFNLARQASSSPYLAYVNADILLLPEILAGVRQVAQNSEKFLMIGQRWDLELTHSLDFSDGWETRLGADLQQRGALHAPAGSDYFIFPRALFTEMPAFAIGRAGWDNWMIYQALQQGWAVVDATPSVRVVHQNHDYSHLPGGKPHYDQPESQQNMALGGGLANMYMLLDANRQLINGELRHPPRSRARLLRSIERRLMPPSGKLTGLRGAIARRFRQLRRKAS